MRHLAAALPLLVLLAAPARADEWLVTYAATEEQQIESADTAAPARSETRAYTETIALARDTLVVRDDRHKTIRDFARHRFTVLNLATNAYDEGSLFSTVDFFEAELFNRNGLGAALRAAKVTSAAAQFDRFDNETSLRLESRPHPLNPPKPVIESAPLAHGTEFRCHGQTAVRFIPSDVALPAGLRHRFVNYLAHACAIHPEIRRALADSATLPQELVFTSRNLNRVTTTTLRLVSAHPSAGDGAELPPDALPATHPDDPILQLLARVRAAERAGPRPTRDDAIAFAHSACTGHRPLDALMALLEYGLQSGEQLPDEIRRHRAEFDRDSACRIYLKAFDQSSKAACEKSLAANATIDRTGLQHASMLDLQRANLLEPLGQTAEAQAAYLAVIRANPFHAGALHDLGLLLARRFDHANAWRCWDAARRLSPAHPMLQEIAAREQQLLSRYPEFF